MFSGHIKKIVGSGLTALLLLMFAVVAVGYSYMSASQQQMQQLAQLHHRKINLVIAFQTVMLARAEQALRMAHSQDTFERNKAYMHFNDLASKHRQVQKTLASLLSGFREKAYFDEITVLAENASIELKKFVELVKNGKKAAADNLLVSTVLPLQSEFLARIKAFLQHERSMSYRALDRSEKNNHKTLVILSVLTGIAFALSLIIITAVLRFIGRSEQALFAESVLQAIGDAVITTDASGHINYLNGKAASMLKINHRAAIGKRPEQLFDRLKDESSSHISIPEHLLSMRNNQSGEVTLRINQHSIKHYEYSISPIRNHNAELQGLVLCCRDTTERISIQSALSTSQNRLSLVMKGTNDGIWDYCLETGEIYFSPKWKEMLGFDENEFEDSFSAWQAQIHPRDLGNVLLTWTDCMNGISESFDIEYRMQSKNGDWLWIECRGLAVLDKDCKPVRLTGSHTDITARKKAEQALHAAKEHAEVTLQSIGDAVITLDQKGNISYLNAVAEQLSGWSCSEATGKPFENVIRVFDENDGNPVPTPMGFEPDPADQVTRHNHIVLISRNGDEHSVEQISAPIRDRSGSINGVVTVLRDVSTERNLKRQLYWQATHDDLTGLANRSSFEARLTEAIESARLYHEEYALLYMDLDQFKVVNDTCGHVAGDELLRQLASLLKKNLRGADTLARLGGDEFGILLDRCPLNDAVSIAQSLKESIRDYRFGWENKTFEVGACIGVVAVNSTSASREHLMSAADVACYAAKDLGRNRVHLYEGAEGDLSQRHGEMHWVTRISEALQGDRFVLYKQDIVGIRDGQDEVHQEILLRMLDDDGKIVPPGAFIPAAERYNLMPAIDRWVIRNLFTIYAEQIQRSSARQNRAPGQQIYTINLSGNSINDTDFLKFVREQILRHNLPAENFCFEITETSAITNLSSATDFIHELKQLGCLFALDDFGSGLSSFGYLKNLPVDFLKIDGQFVKDIVDDPIDAEMVRSINEIGHVMGMRTIAEFVENDAILAKLKDIGVDYAQGYGIAKPEPLITIEQRKTAS